MRHTIPLFALLFAVAGPLAAAEPERVTEPVPEGHDVIFIGGRRMIVIRFEILVDGRPSHEVWNEFLDEQFKQLDQNADGTLGRDERQRLPSRGLFEAMNFVPPSNSSRAASSLLMQNPRESVTDRAHLERYFEQIGFRPFQITAQTMSRTRFISSGRVQSQSGETGKILFRMLDHDDDEALDRGELEQAAHQLRRTDFDKDESVSSGEIDSSISDLYPFSEATANVPDVPFISLDRSTLPRGRAERAMALLAAPTMKSRPAFEQRLVSSDLDHSEEFFATSDRDSSSEIDLEKLVVALEAPSPDVIVTLRYGDRDSGLRLIDVRAINLSEAAVSSDPATAKIAFSGIELVFSPRAISGEKAADQLQQLFRRADDDNNGYLDRNEAAQLGSLRKAFAELDSDHNAQLFLNEFQQGLQPVMTAGRQQFQLAVDTGAFNLFRALDTTWDGRLTPRELRALPQQVLAWDRNGDHKVHTGELPQRYELTVGSEPASPARSDGVIIEEVRSTRSQPRPGIRSLLGTVAPPVWFSRMDRNEDGDLSPREFLGTETDFRKLDRNTDGLISPGEAIQPVP